VRPVTGVFGAIGLLLLAASVAGARQPVIGPRERAAFTALNGLPDVLYWPLWVPMQLGNLVVGTVVGLGLAWITADGGLAIAVGVAVVLKLASERLLRRWLAGYLDVRQRPGTSEPGARLRGDVPVSGPSFPSGHVILVAAVGTVVAAGLSLDLVWAPVAICLLVALARVYVGAHNPLDVTAGLGAGLLVGALLALSLR
jgi:membrane-associated phospholipid phosphatase